MANPPGDLMGYDDLQQEALRGVVRAALKRVAARGLPGDHHFRITFKTKAQGVSCPPELIDKFPDEMTIVLQHQFADLAPGETFFSVTLRFGGVPKNLSIPYAAITQFWDPTADYSLAFTVPDPPPPAPAPALPPKPAADKGDDGPKIVSLDQFRKK